MLLPRLQLNKDQERRLLAGHLWVYNNEINQQKTPLASFQIGELVEVISHAQKPLGIAYVNPHTLLCARLLTRQNQQKIDTTFFRDRLKAALQRREILFQQPYYRWVFAESDGLPGLIIDRFGDVAVVQINTAGMERLKDLILEAILQLIAPQTIIWRNDSSYREIEQLSQYVQVAYGKEVDEHLIKENDCLYQASLQSGQKTGWFYDHRDNRMRIASYVSNKTVLDVFSYLGAFAIPIAKAGAQQVTCVDSSKTALLHLEHNAKLNQVEKKIQTLPADAFDFLSNQIKNKTFYDVVIIDPPALIKKKKEYQKGLRAYEKLNELALSVLNPGGVLFSASCSMHLSDKDLLNCIRRASLQLKRDVAIIEQVHQGRDHPIHPAIPETNYLKGFTVLT